MQSFLGKFGGMDLEETSLPSASVNTLDAFMEKFTPLAPESYFFYNNTIELRFNVTDHKYYKVGELGQLIEQYGVTSVLRVIDKSAALVPWGCKMMSEKLLRTIPTINDWLAPIHLADFTKLVMEAKGAHKEKLEEAGDIGHAAHKCLEESIQHAIDHTAGVVHALIKHPEDEKAKACAEAAFNWMLAHKVRWLKTEQKIYSREYEYAGTLDGKALVDSCDDPSCCTEQFKDSLSIVDWKSSNDLHVDYILQAAGAYEHAEREEYGEDIQNCFILRLGKNAEEAGKFAPWRVPARLFPRAFEGFLLCLNLVRLIDELKEWISTQKKGVREIKKKQNAEQKEIAKMKAKVEREEAKAKLKIERAEEKARIKMEAKANREAAKRLSV
jgi:hypothetical protein